MALMVTIALLILRSATALRYASVDRNQPQTSMAKQPLPTQKTGPDKKRTGSHQFTMLLNDKDDREFRYAAARERISIAEFLRRAGRERARRELDDEEP